MFRGKIALVLAAYAAVWACSGRQTSAATLLIDFGPNTPSNSDGSSTNSPVDMRMGAWSSASPTWNVVGTSDVNVNSAGGTLSYIDGTTAGTGGSGVGLDLAAAAGASDTNAYSGPSPATLTFGDTVNQPTTSSALGGFSSGIYANTGPARDGTFENPNNEYTGIGANITNLPAGTYEVFVTARNTNGGAFTTPEDVWINATNAAGSYSIPSVGSAFTEANSSSDAGTGGFIVNENYVTATVTLPGRIQISQSPWRVQPIQALANRVRS